MYIQKSESTNNITTNIDDRMHVAHENLCQYKKLYILSSPTVRTTALDQTQ